MLTSRCDMGHRCTLELIAAVTIYTGAGASVCHVIYSLNHRWEKKKNHTNVKCTSVCKLSSMKLNGSKGGAGGCRERKGGRGRDKENRRGLLRKRKGMSEIRGQQSEQYQNTQCI